MDFKTDMIKIPLSLERAVETGLISREDLVAKGFESEIDNLVGNEEILSKPLAGLTPRERKILILYFGLDGSKSHTLEQIAKQLGLTRERIRQIKKESIRFIQKEVERAIRRERY